MPSVLGSSVSNTRLHCCLVILIMFILIFLSVPLLLIWLASDDYEEANTSSETTVRESGQDIEAGTGIESGKSSETNSSINSQPISTSNPLNCTEYAIHANLSLANEKGQCAAGFFSCPQLCPEICIEQRKNCNKIADCPDKMDELYKCLDSHGGHTLYLQKVVEAKVDANANSSFATPASCSQDKLLDDACPCVMTDPFVVLCDGLGLKWIPNTLRSSVYKIRMVNNSISDLEEVEWPRSLAILALANNEIRRLRNETFLRAPETKKIFLNDNKIREIEEDALAGLNQLSWLLLHHNQLNSFNSSIFKHTPMIKKIDLNTNQIELPEETRFGDYQHIEELFLDHNHISRIRSHWFRNMSSLKWISLAHNRISIIEDESFVHNTRMVDLDLSSNRIIAINRLTFGYQLIVNHLGLGNNRIESIPRDAFRELSQLKSLNLKGMKFRDLEQDTFSHLHLLEFIYFARFRYCHYASHVRVCHPRTDGLSTSKELLAYPILKYAVWIVALVCSLGNVFVFVWRSVSPHEDQTLSLFVRNLSIADLMMGIYLCAIGWQNRHFGEKFGQHAIKWMTSWQCTAIGFLAILSSELSVFILTIITIERYRSITSINRHEESEMKRRARVYVYFAWLFSILIALYPLLMWNNSYADYYAANGLCLPLHIDQPFTPGWQFSAFIYLGINFAAVLIIVALYVRMYHMIMSSRQNSRPMAEKREDAILAIRFFFIVVTDCLCWIPIVVIKLIALTEVAISPTIYGWLVVFIIPVNSALNPIIYTLAAPTSLRDHVCRLLEHLCNKVDLILPTRNGSGDGISNSLATTTTTTTSIVRDSSNHYHHNNNRHIQRQGTCLLSESDRLNNGTDSTSIIVSDATEPNSNLTGQSVALGQRVSWRTNSNSDSSTRSGSSSSACDHRRAFQVCDFFSNTYNSDSTPL